MADGWIGVGYGGAQPRVVAGDLAQVFVGEVARHVDHLRVRAPSVAKVHELPVEVFGWLARNPRVVLVLAAAFALPAVTERARQEPLLERVGELRAGIAHRPRVEARREKAKHEPAHDVMHWLLQPQATVRRSYAGLPENVR